MAETVKGINVVIGTDTTGLSKALSDVTKKSKDIQAELKQVEKLLKLDPKNTELLAQKQQLLAKAVESSRERLDRLRSVQEQVNQQFAKGDITEGQYRAFQREVAAAEKDLQKLEKQLKDTGMTAEQLGKKLQDTGKKLTDVGKDLTMKVSVPIAAAGVVAGKAAIDFESAFAGVRKTVDATEAEFKELGTGIRDMSKEIPAAATEIAGVGEAAGQLGIKTDNILGFSRVMIDLGEATNLSANDAATALARLANITQMPQDQFDRLGSTIVALGNNLATTESEIVAMGLRLAGAGKQLGLSEAQIMSLAGALSSVGIEAEAGGSAFSKLMLDMQLAVETSSARMKDFAKIAGMSGQEFQKTFKDDAAGAIIAFIKGLSQAEERGTSAIQILDAMGITEVRMRDALLRAAGASDVFTNALELGSKAWDENNALSEEAAKRYETTASQLKILRNNITDVLIQFGDILLPMLRNLTDSLKGIVGQIGNMSPAMKNVTVAVGGIAVASGPALVATGSLITSFGKVVEATGKVTHSIAGLVGQLRLVTVAPILLAVAALTAAVIYLNTRQDEYAKSVNDYLETAHKRSQMQENEIKVLEVQASSLKKLGDEYVTLKEKIDSGKLSEVEAIKAKGDLAVAGNNLIPIIGQEGLERLKAAENNQEAVNVEITAIEAKVKARKEALRQAYEDENKDTDIAITGAENRILAIQKEARAYTLAGKIKEAYYNLRGMSWDTAIALDRLYADERQKELDKAFEQLEEVKAKKHRLGGDEDPSKVNYADYKVPTDSFADFTTEAEKSSKAAKDNREEWEKTNDSLTNGLQILQAVYSKTSAEMSENASKTEQLQFEYDALNDQANQQARIVDNLRQAHQEAIAAKGADAEATKSLELKLRQAEAAEAEMRKKMRDATAAIREQADQFKALSDEITTVETKYRDDLAAALDDYQKKVKDINSKLADDERKLTQEYENQLAQRANALSNFVGLFDEVTKKDITGEQLLANLRGQVETFEDWSDNIRALAARGVDQGLIEELREMGPKAAPEIAALNTLTDAELQEYVALWRDKNEAARVEAVNQLQQQKIEMQQKMVEIRQEASAQLEAYRLEWEKKNAEIRKNAETELNRITEKFNSTAQAGTVQGMQLILNFAQGMESQFERLRSAVSEAQSIIGSLDPTVRHSPSLVDRVRSGMEEISAIYRQVIDSLQGLNLREALSLGQGIPLALAGATYNSGGTTTINHINITVQDGEDLLRTLHKLGWR